MMVHSIPSRAARAATILAAAILAAPVPAAGETSAGQMTASQMPIHVNAGSGAICGERGAVVTRLRDQYGETRRGYGLQREASVVEVYASAATGSWTILVTMANGVACLVATGEHWAPVAGSPEASGPQL